MPGSFSSYHLGMDDHEHLIAIDPGANGGFARFWGNGVVMAWKMPVNEAAIAEFIADELAGTSGCRSIVLEQVWTRENDSKRSATTFMRHVGFLRGCFYTAFRGSLDLEDDFIEVPPTVWQKALGCPTMSKDKTIPKHKRKTAHKNALKQMAIEMFPGIPKITLSTCDALLIGAYARKR